MKWLFLIGINDYTYSQLAYSLWLFVNLTIKDSVDNWQTVQNSNFRYYHDRLNYMNTLSMIMPNSKMSHQSHNFEPDDRHTQTRIQDFLILIGVVSFWAFA